LYAAVGDSTITKIDITDPANPTIISTTNVGFWDGDMEVTPDGSRLYAAEGVGNTVAVVDTATMTRVDTVQVGPVWDLDSIRSETTDATYNVAVSPDGTRTYVTQRVLVVERGVGGQTSGWFIGDSQGGTWLVTDSYSAVSVIDTDPNSATYNQEIARITIPDGAYDIALDGTRAYVTSPDGKTVTVIDTRTNTVVGTFTTDENSTSTARTIAVGSDGVLYITDYYDNMVYAVTVGQSAQQM
jgi:YVTN family beta-propeller protein